MPCEFKDYFAKAPDTIHINYWDLPRSMRVKIRKKSKIKSRCKTISIGKLCDVYGKNIQINKEIYSIFPGKSNSYELIIKLPFSLKNIPYVRLYSLMLSEGSVSSEFRIHVPEEDFHALFKKSIQNLFGEKISRRILKKKERNTLRSSAPRALRYLVPIPEHIPRFILSNKEFCREYLRIAFEAEGYLCCQNSKTYIRLTRCCDVSQLARGVNGKINERIYRKELQAKYPFIFEKLEKYPPITLVGEHLMLKDLFGINNIFQFECLRLNKTARLGKITARWNIFIYAEGVNKFIDKIGFITTRKRKIASQAIKRRSRRHKFFAFELIKKIANKSGAFTSKEFTIQMEKLGYKTPRTHLAGYLKKKIVERKSRGNYVLRVLSKT